ncbi:MAG: HAMP domain-containing sensor histidine kinase [Lentisphaeria bacterium]
MFWNNCRFFKTLKFKVASFYASLFLISLILCFTFIYLFLRTTLYNNITHKLHFFVTEFSYEYLTQKESPVGATRLDPHFLSSKTKKIIAPHIPNDGEIVLALDVGTDEKIFLVNVHDYILELRYNLATQQITKERISNLNRLTSFREELTEEAYGEGRNQMFFLLCSPKGKILIQSLFSEKLIKPFLEQDFSKFKPGEPSFHSFKLDQTTVKLVNYKFYDNNTLIIGSNIHEIQHDLDYILSVFFFALILMSIIGTLSGWLLAGKFTKTIDQVAAAAEKLRAGDFSRHVDYGFKSSELDNLVDTFNEMARNIDKLLHELKAVSDDIAHDLKTPITRMQGEAELAAATGKTDNLPANVSENCEEMLSMINTMLEITRTECEINKKQDENLQLDKILLDIVELFTPVAEDKHITVSSNFPKQAVFFSGRKSHFQRLLGNLLDNAIKFTPKSGAINVSFENLEKAVQLKVKDSGCGITEKDQKIIFNRFYRADASRNIPGNGLGLSLVKAIVSGYKGQIDLISKKDEGTTFIVTLPKNENS